MFVWPPVNVTLAVSGAAIVVCARPMTAEVPTFYFPPPPDDEPAAPCKHCHSPPTEPRILDFELLYASDAEIVRRVLACGPNLPFAIFGIDPFDQRLTDERYLTRKRKLLRRLHPDKNSDPDARSAYIIAHDAAVDVHAHLMQLHRKRETL